MGLQDGLHRIPGHLAGAEGLKFVADGQVDGRLHAGDAVLLFGQVAAHVERGPLVLDGVSGVSVQELQAGVVQQLACLEVGRPLLDLLVEVQQGVRLAAVGLPLEVAALVDDVGLAVDDVQQAVLPEGLQLLQAKAI